MVAAAPKTVRWKSSKHKIITVKYTWRGTDFKRRLDDAYLYCTTCELRGFAVWDSDCIGWEPVWK